MAGEVVGLDHLGIAVKDPRARLKVWAEALGLDVVHVEKVPSEGVRTWFLDAGGIHVELLEPLDDTGPVGKFLTGRGEGIHHVCFRVDDIEAAVARLVAAGIEPVGEIREGAGGARVAFLHPRDTGGVLVELAERSTEQLARQAPFAPGSLVVAYLREPRELCIGVLHRLDGAGTVIEGLDLNAWDDWVSQWSKGDAGPLAPSTQFFPSSRMEKILADRDSDDLPSYERQFRDRTGRDLRDALPALGMCDSADRRDRSAK